MIFAYFTFASFIAAVPQTAQRTYSNVKANGNGRIVAPTKNSVTANVRDRNGDGKIDYLKLQQNNQDGRYNRFTALDSNYDGTFDTFRYRSGQNSYSGYPIYNGMGPGNYYNNGLFRSQNANANTNPYQTIYGNNGNRQQTIANENGYGFANQGYFGRRYF
jgi:ABC-type antimicrobial peptide transport system permease subunit